MFEGAIHSRFTCPLPGVAARFWGADGTVGVVEATGLASTVIKAPVNTLFENRFCVTVSLNPNVT